MKEDAVNIQCTDLYEYVSICFDKYFGPGVDVHEAGCVHVRVRVCIYMCMNSQDTEKLFVKCLCHLVLPPRKLDSSG
jgi:hypothetical protein